METSLPFVALSNKWTLFAPLSSADGNLSLEELTLVPPCLKFGGETVHPIALEGSAMIDLSSWLGAEPHEGKCAFVYIPFTVSPESLRDGSEAKELEVFFEVEADGVYEAWVDGRPAYHTLLCRNDQYIYKNHKWFIPLTLGSHLLVIRVISGSRGNTLRVSVPEHNYATREGNRLVYRGEGQIVAIQAWGRDGLRVRVTPDGGGQTSNWALDIPLDTVGDIKITPVDATLTNGKISVRIHDLATQNGHMEFFRQSGGQKISLLSEFDYVVRAHDPGARSFKAVENGLFHSELHLAPREGERFYGMGQNGTKRLNLKGSVIDLYQCHTKQTVPFVVSSEGYGFLWNNPSLGRVEFGHNRTRWVSDGCRQMDYFITVGDDYAEIMEHYATATGFAPEFPYWASGFWQCKLRYKSQEEFLDAAREFKRRSLPLSVLVIDFCHWDIRGNWRLDPAYWPDPQAMVKEVKEMGVRIMISPWTLLDEASENFAPMKQQGLFTRSIDGTKDLIEIKWNNSVTTYHQYDPTHPKAAEYLWNRWKANYFDLGIQTFWLDPCDDTHAIADFDQVLFHIGPAKECHSFFVVAHQKNIFEGLHAAGEQEVVTICRNAWAGSQRYGASPAPHDIMSSFEHFEEYMKSALNLAMSGIPWGASEIGGFVTPDNVSPRFHELMVRWYQYGVFTPVFRTHGNRKNNEPWNIGGNSYPLIREALFLRERLRPYVMEQMRRASEKGLPPMRPLFFDFKDDLQTAEIEDQFLFGSDLLVAPITQYEQRSREVYLPKGVEWLDAYSGERFEGGSFIKAAAPIERIPVYINGRNPGLLRLFTSPI